jgi:predicted small lipoprotein YifL
MNVKSKFAIFLTLIVLSSCGLKKPLETPVETENLKVNNHDVTFQD